MNDDARRRFVGEAVAARAKAELVLRDLVAASRACDAQLDQQHRPDPIRLVTGRSSLEQAIDRTRRMIDTLDRALDDADRLQPGLRRSTAAPIAMPRGVRARTSVA